MIVEFKLRKQLTPVKLIHLSRQIRWYAWARQRVTDRKVVGVLVDERLNEAPKPARILKNGEVSSAKDQVTSPELYMEACRERDQVPDPYTLEALSEPCVAATDPGVLWTQ